MVQLAPAEDDAASRFCAHCLDAQQSSVPSRREWRRCLGVRHDVSGDANAITLVDRLGDRAGVAGNGGDSDVSVLGRPLQLIHGGYDRHDIYVIELLPVNRHEHITRRSWP